MSSTSPTIAENRRAGFDYELSDQLEAGLVLKGWEVKALRAGRGQLAGGYVLIRDGEAWLPGLQIAPLPYAAKSAADEADRSRKLLLTKTQILRIARHCQAPGYSCVPLRLYWKGQLVKVGLALARGRKKHDKRRHLRDREYERRKVRLRRGQLRSFED